MAKKQWEFLWREENRGTNKLRSRTYTAKTLLQACDKMLAFLQSRDGSVVVDYEACAIHVRYKSKYHTAKYPDLRTVDHRIREYIA